jgi:pyruvate kinase
MKSVRRTKIVATLGPATTQPQVVRDLVAAGVDVARLNASHGDHAFFRDVVGRLRDAADELDRTIAVLLDLQGPKVRVGDLRRGEPVRLEKGASLTVSTEDFEGDATRIPCSYVGLPQDVQPGDALLLDDGMLELKVVEVPSDTAIRCEVVVGGSLGPHKGINVPGRPLSAPAVSEKDLHDLEAALDLGVDYVALSFVRSADDVVRLRQEMEARAADLPIIAKIEKPQALEHLSQILEVSDGIMVARGDLGVEVAPERVPSWQKVLIQKANDQGIPVITATQMLESMIHNPRPTRAEASDVANAILDGTDAVMLSGETAIGDHPVKVVEMMARIACETEASQFYRPSTRPDPVLACFSDELIAMVRAARHVAERTGQQLLVVYTQTGTTALASSKLALGGRIVALTPDPGACRRMALYNGVLPLRSDAFEDTDSMLRRGDEILLERGLVEQGDSIVVLGGTRQFAGATNLIQLRLVGGDDDR